MEYYYFVIIVIIVLKILFWTFYFYVRAQRMRQTQTTHRFIIVGARPVTRARGRAYNDRSAIIDHAEPVSATGPPPYAEVVKDGSNPLPPTYDQATAVPTASANVAMPTSNPAVFQGTMGGPCVGGISTGTPYSQGNASEPSTGSAAVSGYAPAAGQIINNPTPGSSHLPSAMEQNFPTAPQQ